MSKKDAIVRTTVEIDLGHYQPKPSAIGEGVLERSQSVWEGPRVETGIWEATPGQFHASREGHAEVCYIIAGIATIRVEGQPDRTIRAGDVLVMPSGWRGIWHVHETIRKHYTVLFD